MIPSAPRPGRVLVVEDEAVLRGSMVRALAKVPGVDVAGAGTIGEALTQIDAAPPSLIVSDIDLPDRSGIELIGELSRRGLRVPILFVSAYLKAYRSSIPPHADVEVMEKPISLDDLRAVVRRRLGASSDAEEPAPFGVPEYLQLACLGRHTAAIEIGPAGRDGRVTIVNGELWSAADAHGHGEEAFRRLVLAPPANVHCVTKRGDPGARDLHAGWEQLLLDAARAHDEAQAGRPGATGEGEDDFSALDEPTPPAPVVEAAPLELPAPAEPGFDEIWERGVEALLGRRHEEAARWFGQARRLRPDDKRVDANLFRLAQLGFLPPEE